MTFALPRLGRRAAAIAALALLAPAAALAQTDPNAQTQRTYSPYPVSTMGPSNYSVSSDAAPAPRPSAPAARRLQVAALQPPAGDDYSGQRFRYQDDGPAADGAGYAPPAYPTRQLPPPPYAAAPPYARAGMAPAPGAYGPPPPAPMAYPAPRPGALTYMPSYNPPYYGRTQALAPAPARMAPPMVQPLLCPSARCGAPVLPACGQPACAPAPVVMPAPPCGLPACAAPVVVERHIEARRAVRTHKWRPRRRTCGCVIVRG